MELFITTLFMVFSACTLLAWTHVVMPHCTRGYELNFRTTPNPLSTCTHMPPCTCEGPPYTYMPYAHVHKPPWPPHPNHGYFLPWVSPSTFTYCMQPWSLPTFPLFFITLFPLSESLICGHLIPNFWLFFFFLETLQLNDDEL